MSSFQVVDSSPGSSVSVMETSNFAHVIFQNVGKSFLPQAPLECRYTLTPYITPHPKDWVGIFKVGWSTARDYYTFVWSPMPENYEPGSTVHRAVVFQGYYVPKSDGEFYQFCYVTHAGDIRGASTPFQFRSATPTEELLTVTEDDSNSDILVVTTKTGLLERVEEAQQERRELLKAMRLLQEEKQQLQEEQKRLAREREQERETCCLLRTHNQELLRSSQGLSEEREEVRRRLTEATDRVRQLEEDLLGVTQRGLQKETELDCLRDRLKKLTAERDSLESQLKNEKDERDLYKAHLRSTELENTKLSAELQMLKAVELNREVTIAQFQEELERLRACVAQRDSLEKELLAHKADKAELARVREQLRQAEEQLQASRQQASLLASELRDSASTRDHTMTELYRARLEADKLRASLADAQAECQRMESQLDRMRSTAQKEVGVGTNGDMTPSMIVVSEAEAELQREVEELKLRLHMAAEHYKEKYRECQRLRRQVAKLNTAESQGEPKRNASTETTLEPLTPSPESPTGGNIAAAVLQEAVEMTITPEVSNKEVTNADTKVCTEKEEQKTLNTLEEKVEVKVESQVKQMDDNEKDKENEKEERKESLPEESLRMASWVEVENERLGAEESSELEGALNMEESRDGVEEQGLLEVEERCMEEAEKEQTRSVEEELAMMEEKWREQCAINETLKQRLADEEERFRVQMAERASEVTELKRNLAQALRDKAQLQEQLQRYMSRQREQEVAVQGAEVRQPMVLRYPLPYPQDPSPPPLVPQRPAELQYGNPYSTDTTRDRVDVALSPEHVSRPPPEAPSCTPPCAPPISPSSPGPGAPGWDREVVCIQPSRSTSPPETLEHPPEEPQNVGDGAQQSCDHQPNRRSETRSSFCFDSRLVYDMNDKQDRPYLCGAPGCSQRFQLEEHLIIHRHKHEMTLKFPSIKTDAAFTDQTPTPTRFLQNCEEVGLFKEIEEEFLQAQEEENKKQSLSHNGPSCMSQHQLKPQLQLQHPPQPQHPHPQPPLHHPQTHALHHPQTHGPMMAPSCSLAAQQALSSSQSGSVITQATSTLTHSEPVPGPLSCLLHMRNRHRQPLPASLPGTLPDPAMQGASAQHMTIEKQMSCAMGIPAPVHNPSCSSPQRSKQTLGHHYQQHHPGMITINNNVPPMGHMIEMMPQRHQTPPLQQQQPQQQQHHHHPHHHHHPQPHHSQLPPVPLTYQQRCHAPHPQHLGSTQSHQLHQAGNLPPHAQAHQSPPSHLHPGSPPAPPLSAPAQLSPVAQQMQPSQPSHTHAMQAVGSCSGGGGGGVGGGGNRRRRTVEQDPDERRQKFLERNRAAATRCRQKRKLWVSSLEKKAEELTHTNLQLQNEVTSLRSEVGQLKQILLTHKDCPVTARQREAQGYPTAGVSPGGSPTPAGPGSHLQAIQHNSISTSSTSGGDSGHDLQPGH